MRLTPDETVLWRKASGGTRMKLDAFIEHTVLAWFGEPGDGRPATETGSTLETCNLPPATTIHTHHLR